MAREETQASDRSTSRSPSEVEILSSDAEDRDQPALSTVSHTLYLQGHLGVQESKYIRKHLEM